MIRNLLNMPDAEYTEWCWVIWLRNLGSKPHRDLQRWADRQGTAAEAARAELARRERLEAP